VRDPGPVFEPVRRHLSRLRLGGVVAQHARGSVPDPAHGVCTDDVARSMEVDLLHGHRLGWSAVDSSLHASLTFLEAALSPATGRFRNVQSMDGSWLDDGSDDAQGRAIAALGQVMASAGRPAHRLRAEALFLQALPDGRTMTSLRSIAAVALGCDAAAETRLGDIASAALREAVRWLVDRFAAARGTAWPWPEPVLTYESMLVARALIQGGARLGDASATRLGLDTLDWHLAAATANAGTMSFVGNDGWWPRDGVRARFDQQPIEASSMFMVCEAAAAVTGEDRYSTAMEAAYAWFLGANDHGVPIARPRDGACHDGLTTTGVNANQGAESTLAWLLVAARFAETRRQRPTFSAAPVQDR
jgi:hypothetical protein